MLILPFPNNPTGAILTRDELEAIADVLRDTDICVLSDEIYAELTYGKNHTSIAEIDGMWERTIIASGFSKAYAMTGWRLGYICAPKTLCEQMLKLHQYAIMCAPTCSQYAALEALKQGKLDGYKDVCAMRDDYDNRRKFMVEGLRDAGLKCFEPKGAFYLFPSVGHLGVTGEEFAEGLLKAKSVAVVPGSAFGESGKYHVRCCYATSMEKLKIAVQKIAEYVNELKNK
jgi:aminotransferase